MLQLGLRKAPELLGQDFGDLNKLVIKMYPLTAAKELGKLFLLTWVSINYYFFISYHLERFFLTQRRFYRPYLTMIISIVLFFYIWMMFFLGSALDYPALFENFFPLNSPFIAYFLVQYARPQFFYLLGTLGLLGPIILFLWNARKNSYYLRCVLAVIALAFLGLNYKWVQGVLHATPQTQLKSPNIILIAIDSLRLDRFKNHDIFPVRNDLISLGNTIEFQDHIVGIPRTFPSWAEILSGRYAMSNHIRNMFPNFKDRFFLGENLVEVLQEAGYKTSVFSDFAGDIFPRFSLNFQKQQTPNMTLDSLIAMNIDLLFPLNYPWLVSSLSQAFFPDLKSNPAFADPKVLTDEASSYLLKHRTEGPFFSIIFFSTAHFPYAAPYPYYKKYGAKDYQGRFSFQKNPSLNEKDSHYSAEDIQQIRALYDGSLNAINDALRAFLRDLKNAGILENTIIVLTADHGEDLLEPGFLHGHGEHLRGENVLHVPLLLSLPANINVANHQVSQISRSVDIAPTLLSLSGIQMSEAPQGRDLSPLFLTNNHHDRIPEDEDFAYSETGLWFSNNDGGFYQKERLPYPNITGLLKYDLGGSSEIVLDPLYESRTSSAKHRAITTADYRLIYLPTPGGVKWKLFNRKTDPYGKIDLAQQQPDIVNLLRQKLFALIKKHEAEHTIIDDFVVYHD